MTEEQIKVDALLIVARLQLKGVLDSIEPLQAANRNGKLRTYCETSNSAAARLEAAVAALLGAHRISQLTSMMQGGLVH